MTVLSAARVAGLGFCPHCYARGQTVPVVPGRGSCTAHVGRPDPLAVAVETARSGQIRLAVPEVPRRSYATGLQVRCEPCAVAGVYRLGMPRDGADSPPLCMSCWRGQQERRARQEKQELAKRLWEGIGEASAAASCVACGEPEPVPECWLCSYSWIAAARAEHELAEVAQVAAEKAEFARIRERTTAERRVEELTAWIERLRSTLEAYAAGRGQGRAVELVADLLARDAADRNTGRGRPSALARVGAVLAVDSDWRSGRRALPGRGRTALLAGCSVRAVSSAWKRGEALGWSVRTRQGRRLTLVERVDLGRWNDRAEFDLAPLHRGDATARAAFVPAALGVLGELLQHALGLWKQALDDLDELRARTGAWTEWRERARRAQLRQAVTRALHASADQAQQSGANFCTPRTASKGEYFSSCLSRGLHFSPSLTFRHETRPGRPSGRRMHSASRSPRRASRNDLRPERGESPPLKRPRPIQEHGGTSRAARPRPDWADWAYPLARALRTHWAWLAETPLPRVAATLGRALGPDWTAEALIAWTSQQRIQPLLAEPRDPAAYLRAVLTEVLTGPAEPPNHAARTVAYRRASLEAAGGELRAAQDATRVADEARSAAAVPGHTNAAVRALRARWGTATTATTPAEETWPEVRQPGSGSARASAQHA